MYRGARTTGRRLLFAGSAVWLTLLLATGCTGDGVSTAFQQEFSDEPSIESFDLTSHDNQPFTGGVSGDVIVRDDVTDEDFTLLASRIGDYTRENGDRMQGRVSLVVEDFEVQVTGDEGHDEDAVQLLLALRADERATGAVLDESFVAVSGADAAEAIELARDLPPLLEALAPDRPGELTVRSDDDAVVVTGSATTTEMAVGLWDELTTHVSLSGIRAQEDERTVVTLQYEADLARAREVAAGVALEPDVPLVFASDVIKLGDSDGEDARVLLSRLDDAVRERIVWVWISDERVQVAVGTEADFSIAEAIDVALPSRISEAWLRLDDDADVEVAVRPAGGDADAAG